MSRRRSELDDAAPPPASSMMLLSALPADLLNAELLPRLTCAQLARVARVNRSTRDAVQRSDYLTTCRRFENAVITTRNDLRRYTAMWCATFAAHVVPALNMSSTLELGDTAVSPNIYVGDGWDELIIRQLDLEPSHLFNAHGVTRLEEWGEYAPLPPDTDQDAIALALEARTAVTPPIERWRDLEPLYDAYALELMIGADSDFRKTLTLHLEQPLDIGDYMTESDAPVDWLLAIANFNGTVSDSFFVTEPTRWLGVRIATLLANRTANLSVIRSILPVDVTSSVPLDAALRPDGSLDVPLVLKLSLLSPYVEREVDTGGDDDDNDDDDDDDDDDLSYDDLVENVREQAVRRGFGDMAWVDRLVTNVGALGGEVVSHAGRRRLLERTRISDMKAMLDRGARSTLAS